MPEYASLVYCNFTRDTAGNWLDVGHCTDFLSDCKFFVGHQEEFSEVRGHKVKDSCVTNCSGVFLDEVNWSCTNTSGKSILSNSSNRLSHTSLYTKLDRNKPARVQMGNKEAQFHKRKARKSNSVPPFYKRRRKFFDLNNLFKIEAGQINSDDTTCPEINNPKHKLQAFDQCHLHSKKKCVDDPLCIPRLENEAFLKRGFHLTVHVVFSSLLAGDIFGWSEYSCIMYTFMKHSKTDDYSCCLESIFIAFGCANGYSSPAESGIIYDLSLSTAEYSFFGSLVFFGSMLGAIISGKVADFIGRKGALWLNSLFHIIGWLAIVFAEVPVLHLISSSYN